MVLGTRRKWPRPRRDRDVDNFFSRRDRDETVLVRLETVSRPRHRDRDHNPALSTSFEVMYVGRTGSIGPGQASSEPESKEDVDGSEVVVSADSTGAY